MPMKHVQKSTGKCYSVWSLTAASARQIIFVLHKIKSSFNWAFVKSVLKGTWCFSNLSFFKNTYLKLQGTNEAPEVGTVSHESLSRSCRATTRQEMHSAMSFNSSLHKSICKSTQEAIRKSTWWLCAAVIQAMTEFLNGFLVNPLVPIQHKIRNTSSSLWGRRVMAIRCGNTFLLATQH